MAILDAAEVDIVFLKQGQVVENVFAVQATHPLSEADADAIHSVVDTWITATLQGVQSNDTRYISMTVKDINPGFARFDYPGDNSFGTDASGALPNEVTFCLKKGTALSGRAYRGRFYHIGLTRGMLDGSNPNILTATAVTALVSTYAALMTALNAAGHPLQVIQRNYVTDPPSLKTQVPVISISATDSIVDSQRRRGPGRGR